MTGRVTISLAPPPRSTGATIVLAPSRTTIETVRTKDDDAKLTTELPCGVTFELTWRPAVEGARIELEVGYSGEAVRLLATAWRSPILTHSLPAGTEFEELVYRDVYRQRQAWAARDPEHAFLFEIDRRTNERFIPFAGLCDDERKLTEATVGPLSKSLRRILESRHPTSKLTPPAVDASIVRHYSKIVWRASDLLFAPGTTISERKRRWLVRSAFEHFAAGALRRPLASGRLDLQPVYEADTDSYAVYLFAELALASMVEPPHAKRWRSVLPSLVRMQVLFNVRVDKTPSLRTGYVDQHSYQPPEVVDPDLVDTAWLDRLETDELEKAITSNLCDLGPCGFRQSRR